MVARAQLRGSQVTAARTLPDRPAMSLFESTGERFATLVCLAGLAAPGLVVAIEATAMD